MAAAAERPLPVAFFARSALEVAPALVGAVLRFGRLAARIVEVEAYLGAADAASHAFRGPTRRNAVMFGPPGVLYVYFTYGMHWCANVVTGSDGDGQAVLLRAAQPMRGLAQLRAARPAARADRDLLRGPARLCQAFGITGACNGSPLAGHRGPGPWLASGDEERAVVIASPRVGITRATERPWRFSEAGSPFVSDPRPRPAGDA